MKEDIVNDMTSKIKSTVPSKKRRRDLSLTGFREKVLAVVRKIPKGKSMTYKEVARKAGNAKAARAVGAIMRSNHNPEIPCHRVVHSDGTLGGYNRGGTQKKFALLRSERAI